MNSGELAQQLRDTAALLDSFPPSTDALRVLRAAENAVAAAQAELVAEMADVAEHETEGYSTPKAWLRAELGLDTRQANQLIAAGSTFRELPEVAQVAQRGDVSLDHVRHFGYAVRHVGADKVRELLPELVDVSIKAEPAALREVVRTLRDAVYPDALDQAWIDGMAREDLQVNPVPDGWHVNGFLNTTTGAKLNTVLQSLSAPAGADDPRTGPQRRVDGLEALLDSVLGHGLPGDQGVRPHLTVNVDAADLMPGGTGEGELVGFGRIGRRQLQQIMCDANLTPVLTAGKHTVLDVGRTHRLATKTQRTAVLARQGHQCAAPGCKAPVVHIHHIVYWSDGGPTDLANLIGLCPRCHRAVHSGTLVIDPETHEFRDRHLRLLPGRDHTHHRRRRLTPAHVRRARIKLGA